MARKKRCKVFVSYSRHDEALVKPLAGLLGVAADAVFLDVNSLKPGDAWESKIKGAIQGASVFVVCWCCESKKSDFVAYEISVALQDEEKKLVPVLFCSAALPVRLSQRNWIDLRKQIVHVCDHGEDETPPSSGFPNMAAFSRHEQKSRKWLKISAAATSVVAAVAAYLSLNPNTSPVAWPFIKRAGKILALTIGGILALFIVLIVVVSLIIAVQSATKWYRTREANRIAAIARSYFEGLS